MPLKDSISIAFKRLTESPGFKTFTWLFRKVLLVFIIGIIIYNLYQIGWDEIWRSLPTQPLFYILFVFIFLSLPIAEIFIYRQVWPLKRRSIFKAMLTKRVYNEEIMGYSGEFYLLTWARKHLDESDWKILANIRDNNILSSITSTTVAFVLIGLLIFTGVIDAGLIFDNVNLVYVFAGTIIVVALILVGMQFRRYIFTLPLNKALVIFSIYMSRFLMHHSLLIAQWAVVIPDTPLSIWFLFIAIIIIINRIPFLPSRDLVFMWAGIELSRMLSMATSSVAGMLLVYSALKKSSNLILYLFFEYKDKGKKEKTKPPNMI